MFIYKITNSINNKIYVGQTTQDLKKRWSCHKRDSKRHDYPLCRAIKKYGIENFVIECVETLPKQSSIEELNNREIFWIKELSTLIPNGYNVREGGSRGKHSEETKIKLSVIGKGRPCSIQAKVKLSLARKDKPISEEQKVKLSIAGKGKISPNKGKIMSSEQRAKLSLAAQGRVHSKETKTKISAAIKLKSNK